MRFRFTPLFLVLLALSFSACEKRIERSENLVDYLPSNPGVVIKIANLETAKKDFENSSLYNELSHPLLYEFIKLYPEFVASLKPQYPSAISFKKSSDTTHYTIITKYHPEVFQFDSVAPPTNKKYKKQTIDIIKRDERPHYSTVLDSVFVISSSEKLIENIVDGTLPESDPLRKAFQLNQTAELSSIFTLEPLQIDSTQIQLGTQAAMALDILPKGAMATGVLIDRDSLPSLLSIFEGLVPQRNQIAQVLPVSAKQARVVTFQDAQLLSNNLQTFHKDSIALPSFFDAVVEIGSIETSSGSSMVVRSVDPDITQEELNTGLNELSEFREIKLFRFTEGASLFERFYPILENPSPNILFVWEDFFIFSESQESAKDIITAIKNGSVLEKSTVYEEALPELSQASSFLVYNMQGQIDAWMAPFLSTEEGTVSKHPFVSLQLSSDRDFAHVNLVCKELNGSKKQVSGVVTQLFSESLDAPILMEPQFFTNHRTKGKDMVVQDIENRLYLISSSGKVLWKKRLDGPILGDIQEVDILRNGKKQLAFATPKSFQVIDRNGNTVNPFPKKFRDPITQPLAVFDYDNKRKYRFVVTQGKEVHMYDSKGKTVTGFTFKKAQSNIVLPPQHIRMRTKDYLLIAEENGKLNILSRVGKVRVRTGKTFNFSDMPIAKEGDNFALITKEKTKVSISQTGKVTSQSLDVSDNYQFKILGNTKVTLDDNLLRINGKLVELPYGIYTEPIILNSNRGTFIAITETQENKLYVIDKSGTILDGFPVYGTSVADIAIVKGKIWVTAAVGESEIAAYSL
ncbi:hypothetical protein POV27_16580 [Aureisphaera galaxeae]|uniref:hypothetical protein n=1 Tax=Aureisphaera galaxeae TaxID=1538023 RepID=UPI002350964D|nr:hypothetical protein [Aureisphaera galaxeae]MDC8005676.1 hypothetical protein [Aureisphaera galaxeae]